MKRMHDDKKIRDISTESAETLLASGDVESIKADSIIENMTGYSAQILTPAGFTISPVYVGACKNGNKLTIVIAMNITRTADDLSGNVELAKVYLPDDVFDKIYPTLIGSHNIVDVKEQTFWQNPWTNKKIAVWTGIPGQEHCLRLTANDAINSAMTKNTTHYMRYEATLLLNDSLVSNA